MLMWRPHGEARACASAGDAITRRRRINELQVSDGETEFQRAQRATHQRRKRRARPDADTDAARRALPQGIRPSVRAPREPAEYRGRPAGAEAGPHSHRRRTPRSRKARKYRCSTNRETCPAGFRTRIRACATGSMANRSAGAGTSAIIAGAGVVWRGDRWEASFGATWHSGWPTTEVELETLDPFPLVSAEKRNASNVSDYCAHRPAHRPPFRTRIGGRADGLPGSHQLTKRNNDCCVEYQLEDEEEEDVFLDVEPRGSLPLIPSLGVLWKF